MNKYYNGMSRTNTKSKNGYRLYEAEGKPRRIKRTNEGVEEISDRLGCLAGIRRAYASILNGIRDYENIRATLEDNAKNVDPEDLSFSSFYINDIDQLKEELFKSKQDISSMKGISSYIMKDLSSMAKVIFPYTKKPGRGLNNIYVNHVDWLEESANGRSYEFRNKHAGDTGRYRK